MHFYFYTTISFLFGGILNGFGINDTINHQKEKPYEIKIQINVNKIYGINTMDETYIIDGYLVAIWNDQRNMIFYSETDEKSNIYENQRADEFITSTAIHVPAFELINVVGERNTANKQIIIGQNGMTIYNERFNAVFESPMDFRRFPFDNQCFSIQLEAFSYDNSKLIFIDDSNPFDTLDRKMSEEWKISRDSSYVSEKKYLHLTDEEGNPQVFSRYNKEIYANRRARYYILQFILPLFLIIGISWSVFWMSSLADQLSTNFTLMLTVVAFNFSTSNILPRLPYSTFIESLITLGYFSIFVSLIIIIWAYTKRKIEHSFDNERVMNVCKITFPAGFISITSIQIAIYLF